MDNLARTLHDLGDMPGMPAQQLVSKVGNPQGRYPSPVGAGDADYGYTLRWYQPRRQSFSAWWNGLRVEIAFDKQGKVMGILSEQSS